MIYRLGFFWFWLMLLWSAILIVFNIIRLASSYLGIDINVFGVIANAVNFVFLIGASMFVVLLCLQRARASIYSIYFAVAFLYGWVLWFVNEGDFFAAIKHMYLIIFAFFLFEFGRLVASEFDFAKLKNVFLVSFLVNLASVPSFMIISSIWAVYPGYGVQSIAYVSFYFLVAGSKYLSLLSCLILLAQGKRSILLSYIVCFFVYWALVVARSRFILFIGLFLVPVFIAFLLFIIDFFEFYSVPGLSRLKYINPFSTDFDLFLGSSGRADEILSVVKGLANAYLPYLFGAGFGFTYEWELSYRPDFLEIKSYLHNSPLMIYILLGPFFALLFYIFFLGVSLSVMRTSGWGEEGKLLRFSSISALFFLVSGGFSLNILSDPIGWIFLGVICAFSWRKLRARNVINS